MIPMNYKGEVRQIKSELLCFLGHPNAASFRNVKQSVQSTFYIVDNSKKLWSDDGYLEDEVGCQNFGFTGFYIFGKTGYFYQIYVCLLLACLLFAFSSCL